MNDDLAYERLIDATPTAVYARWVDPALLVTWMGDIATLDPAPGGIFRLEYRSGHVAEGRYLDVEPARRLAFTWGWRGESDFPPGSSTIELTFEAAEDGGTLLRLRHHGVPVELRNNVDEGWGYFLPRLDEALA